MYAVQRIPSTDKNITMGRYSATFRDEWAKNYDKENLPVLKVPPNIFVSIVSNMFDFRFKINDIGHEIIFIRVKSYKYFKHETLFKYSSKNYRK